MQLAFSALPLLVKVVEVTLPPIVVAEVWKVIKELLLMLTVLPVPILVNAIGVAAPLV